MSISRLFMSTVYIAAALAATSCSEKRVKVPIPIPPERMDCVDVTSRPTVPPEYLIDWSGVVTVDQARGEHQAFVKRLREREKIIGGSDGYIITLEKHLFACADDATWLRDYSSRLPAED